MLPLRGPEPAAPNRVAEAPTQWGPGAFSDGPTPAVIFFIRFLPPSLPQLFGTGHEHDRSGRLNKQESRKKKIRMPRTTFIIFTPNCANGPIPNPPHIPNAPPNLNPVPDSPLTSSKSLTSKKEMRGFEMTTAKGDWFLCNQALFGERKLIQTLGTITPGGNKISQLSPNSPIF